MEKREDGEKLRLFMQGLNRVQRNEMIKKLVDECKVTYPTINNWRYGVCRIPPLAKDKIEEVVGERIFNC